MTAGPTWVWIDAVRHIGNMSTGRTGLLIARAAADRGAEVTLVSGPGRAPPTDHDFSRMRVLPIVTFDDLHAAVREELKGCRCEVMIHAAAVSDYRPVAPERGKLPSGQDELILRLEPTPKIVDEVKSLDPRVFLVKFKLESGRSEAELLRIAQESRARSGADMIVANDLAGITLTEHIAFILDAGGLIARTRTSQELANVLCDEIGRRRRGPTGRTQ